MYLLYDIIYNNNTVIKQNCERFEKCAIIIPKNLNNILYTTI